MLQIDDYVTDCTKETGTLTRGICTFEDNVVQISYRFYSQSSSVSFKLKKFKNPINREPIDGFSIFLMDRGLNVIAESLDQVLSTTMDTAAQISLIEYNMASNIVTTLTPFTISI